MYKPTKTQIYIFSVIVIGIIAYFVFFRKKDVAKVAAIAPAVPSTSAESNYYGDNWGWKTGPQAVTPAQTLAMVSANRANSVAGTMSNYQQDELTGGRPNFESNYSAAMNKAGSATNFLGY
jgi:hypothetical protein